MIAQPEENRRTMYKQIFFLFIIVSLLSGCASKAAIVAEDGLTISEITIKVNGATSKSRPHMSNICKGFILTKRQVQDFFVYSEHIKDRSSDNSDDILPCYASGSAVINNKPYNWVIRSGGIGDFSDKSDHFTKVCGKGCCDKIPGIC